jgi:hypothetical protein
MMTMSTEHKNRDDAALNAVLSRWQAPAPSPWLQTRITQRLIQDARAQVAWPFSLAKLAGMATAAVLLGGVLGVNLPQTIDTHLDAGLDETALDMPAAAAVADSVDVSEFVTADAETLEGLW